LSETLVLPLHSSAGGRLGRKGSLLLEARKADRKGLLLRPPFFPGAPSPNNSSYAPASKKHTTYGTHPLDGPQPSRPLDKLGVTVRNDYAWGDKNSRRKKFLPPV